MGRPCPWIQQPTSLSDPLRWDSRAEAQWVGVLSPGKCCFICSLRNRAHSPNSGGHVPNMAFHSRLSEIEETSHSLMMNDRDRSDTADTYVCPTTAELSKAVSVSLGLDSSSSPPNNPNHCSGGAFPDCESSPAGNCTSSRAVSELGAVAHTSSLREDDFGKVSHGVQQVSCMDLLRAGDLPDGAHGAVTHGPVISRYVCKESNLFASPAMELPAFSHGDELLPFQKHYYSDHPNLHRDAPGVWCANERAYGGRSEPERGGSAEHNSFGKYCNCGQTGPGSRQECHCLWYGKGEQQQCGRDGTVAQGYGQVERYQSAFAQGRATFPTIKTEPSVWVDCSDRTFR